MPAVNTLWPCIKHTFRGMDHEAILLQPGEELVQVDHVLFWRRCGYKDVIDIHHSEVKPLHHLVHEVLEGLGTITQVKIHLGVFK